MEVNFDPDHPGAKMANFLHSSRQYRAVEKCQSAATTGWKKRAPLSETAGRYWGSWGTVGWLGWSCWRLNFKANGQGGVNESNLKVFVGRFKG